MWVWYRAPRQQRWDPGETWKPCLTSWLIPCCLGSSRRQPRLRRPAGSGSTRSALSRWASCTPLLSGSSIHHATQLWCLASTPPTCDLRGLCCPPRNKLCCLICCLSKLTEDSQNTCCFVWLLCHPSALWPSLLCLFSLFQSCTFTCLVLPSPGCFPGPSVPLPITNAQLCVTKTL